MSQLSHCRQIKSTLDLPLDKFFYPRLFALISDAQIKSQSLHSNAAKIGEKVWPADTEKLSKAQEYAATLLNIYNAIKDAKDDIEFGVGLTGVGGGITAIASSAALGHSPTADTVRYIGLGAAAIGSILMVHVENKNREKAATKNVV